MLNYTNLKNIARQLYYTACHILRRKRFYGFDIPYMWCSNAQVHCAISLFKIAMFSGH